MTKIKLKTVNIKDFTVLNFNITLNITNINIIPTRVLESGNKPLANEHANILHIDEIITKEIFSLPNLLCSNNLAKDNTVYTLLAICINIIDIKIKVFIRFNSFVFFLSYSSNCEFTGQDIFLEKYTYPFFLSKLVIFVSFTIYER